MFEPVLSVAQDLLSTFLDTGALYLYGSVATGQAKDQSSDVDLVAIGVDAGTASAVGRTLTHQFESICRRVEVGAAQDADYIGDDDEAYGNRVFLRHYCVHLAGPSRHDGLPAYPADARAARGFNGNIGLHAATWRRALGEANDPALLARRIARKSLLAVAGLVSMHDNTWTTDRTSSARRWAEIEPGLRTGLEVLVAWFDGSLVPLHHELAEVLSGVVDEVVVSFASFIGLWP